MSDQYKLDSTELLLLMAVMRLGSGAYGVPLREEVMERSGREISRAATYAALDRLEERGFVTSHLGDPTKERGGRAKRFYEIQSAGMRAVNETLGGVGRMAEGLGLEWVWGGV